MKRTLISLRFRRGVVVTVSWTVTAAVISASAIGTAKSRSASAVLTAKMTMKMNSMRNRNLRNRPFCGEEPLRERVAALRFK